MSMRIRLKQLAVAGGLVGGIVGTGCLTRPVQPNAPTTKTNFTANVKQSAIDKIDLLLAIDNSGSMGDKQKFLAEAVPNLVKRLVTPNCVDPNTGAVAKANGATGVNEDATGQFGCAAGSKPEFKPIVDIHIGVVSSDMGSFGSDSCVDKSDKGNLVKRAKDGTGKDVQVNPIEPSGFLAWYPTSDRHGKNPAPAGPYSDPAKISESFASLVRGVGEDGCGLEAQLESMYHFLIQPEPYQAIAVEGGRAVYKGIDNDVLKQRHDFLRTDSLVAVIMLTDEDDSSVDPLSVGGQGYAFMSSNFPAPASVASDPGRRRPDDATFGGGTTAPRGTTACATDPNSADCTSCAFQFNCNAADASCQKIKNDPNCKDNNGYHKPEDDILNVRFQHMKQRFGIDPQYPIRRYVNGLQSKSVPDRVGEHDGAGNYIGRNNCTNPLFAKSLPVSAEEGVDPKTKTAIFNASDENGAMKDDKGAQLTVCGIPRGNRDESLVFFAVVGGVPNDLLHFDPNDADKSRLGDEDWIKILGKDPQRFDYSGIDSRMIQSTQPRKDRPTGAGVPDFNGADPGNATHRDWDTKNADLQYACTFALPSALQKAYTNSPTFDCANGSDSPLCSGDKTKTSRAQVRAKAFPTVRELLVARSLGDQGIASSLCPQETADVNSALYGYNPAVKAIVDRLANAISRQCLPRPLTPDATGQVACLMLAVLPDKGDTCAAHAGYKDVTGDVLKNFRESQKAAGDSDKLTLTVCEIPQVTVAKGQSCDGTSPDRNKGTGWCYVTNDPSSKRCPQAIEFSQDSIVPGATVALQCIDQSGAGAGGTPTP
ncbi:MAG: hypothetical protein HOO96_02550 [Polyangiaceae bacterium]|nr:hypothetical protein [Polyangiaceae bacterium]